MRLNIYYLDDEAELGELFVEFFSSDQVHVESFTNAEAFLRKITEDTPDLIFIDYRLSSLNGDDVAKKIDPSIPKALVTGEIQIAPSYPFFKVFEKPIDVVEVSKAFEDLLAAKKSKAS